MTNFILLCFLLNAPLSSNQKIPLSSFNAACPHIAATLRMWLPSIQKLSHHAQLSATCPSYAHGLGSSSLALLTLRSDLATALASLNEGSREQREQTPDCYSQALHPLCYVNITKTSYQPRSSCKNTLQLFLDLMETCAKDRRDLAHCLSFDVSKGIVTNERVFCANAMIRSLSVKDSDLAFDIDDRADCETIARLYNICILYGVGDLKMESSACRNPLTFGAYCSHDVSLDTSNLQMCQNTMLPAVIWMLGSQPHLYNQVASAQYEDFCKDLQADFMVWLAKRKADALNKADAAQSSLRSSARLIDHLNKMYVNVTRIEMTREHLLLDSIESGMVSLEQYNVTQNTLLRGQIESIRFGVESGSDLQYFPDDKLFMREATVKGFVTLRHRISMCRHSYVGVLKYDSKADAWRRPTFASLNNFLNSQQIAKKALTPCLTESDAFSYLLKAEETNPLTYNELQGFSLLDTAHFIDLADLDGIRRDIDQIRKHAGYHRTRFYRDIERWTEIYASSDDLVEATGKTFAAVAELINAQMEIFGAASK